LLYCDRIDKLFMKGSDRMKQVTIYQELKKDSYLKIRISKKDSIAFHDACKKKGVTVSQELRGFVDFVITQAGTRK